MYWVKMKRQTSKITCVGLCFVFIFSQILLPQGALADRSNAGGGETAEFDFGKVAMSAGISLGGIAVGSALNAGLSSLWGSGSESALSSALRLDLTAVYTLEPAVAQPGFLSAMADAFTNSFSIPQMATNLGTFVATSQVGHLAGAAGNYYGWDPSTTFLVSSVASGATGGFLNPSVPLATAVSDSALSTMGKGALVGGLTSLASSGVTWAIDRERINERRSPGAAGQIGGLLAGVAAGNLARDLVNTATYYIPEEKLAEYKRIENPEIGMRQELAQQARDEIEALHYLQEADQLQQTDPYRYQYVTGIGQFSDELYTANDIYSSSKEIGVEVKPISGGDYFEVVKPALLRPPLNIGSRLFDATFIKTADMWPKLASRSLAILIVNNFVDQKNELFSRSSVNSLVEGFATPLFSGAADYLALKPSLYVGESRDAKYAAFLRQKKDELVGKYPNVKDGIMAAENYSGALQAAGTNRFALFLDNSSLPEMRYGLLEGVVHGGTSYLISQVSKDDLAVAAAGYGATLVSSAMRGVVQRGMYDSAEMEKAITATAPTSTDSIQDRRMKEARRQELEEYKSAMEKGYGAVILTSMAKANRDFLDRTLSFGTPRGEPKDIDSLAMLDYFNRLNSYAQATQRPDWFASGLISGLTNAGSFAISTNIITSLGTIKPVGDILNIQRYIYESKSASRGETYRRKTQ